MRRSIKPIPKRLEYRRLILVAARRRDADEVHQAVRQSFRELRPWMPWAKKRRPSVTDTRAFCRRAERDFAARREFSFLLRRRDSGELVGTAGVVRGDPSVPRFEIGYWLHTPYVGQGYATEAVKALARFARRHLRVRRLELRIDPANVRSVAVAKRAGFKLEAVLRQEMRNNRGRLRDTLVFVKLF